MKKSADFKLKKEVPACYIEDVKKKEDGSMERRYDLNELSLMTGFSSRTLRNHLNKGLLHGDKEDGVWRFSEAEVASYFKEPFVKEGLAIKYHSVVFDFLSQRHKDKASSCVILDVPCDVFQAGKISAFFCEKMKEVKDVKFNFRHEDGIARVILSGDEGCVSSLMDAYHMQKNGLI